VTAAVLISCSTSTSDVCNQADQVRRTVQDLKNFSLSENGMAALTGDLTRLRDQLGQLKSAAAGQYGSEITAVETAINDLGTKATAAKNDPTASSLSAVGTSLTGLQGALQSLAGSVGSC
jgi:hypothetical protein